jgi:hypothetical protein
VHLFEDKEDEWSSINHKRKHETGILQRAYNFFAPIFAFLALASLTLQAIKTRDTPKRITDIACKSSGSSATWSTVTYPNLSPM